MTRLLHTLLEDSARLWPDNVAVADPGGEFVTYVQLEKAANEICRKLVSCGVRPGDRVGICAAKSIELVASVFGILKAGAAYVPVDPTAPARRIAYVFENCQVRAVIATERLTGSLRSVSSAHTYQNIDSLAGGIGLYEGPGYETAVSIDTQLAYILYTSGSTGNPKGVMITHSVAMSFVDWGSDIFKPHSGDVFSNHSPFHFDLSIFDLYVSMKHGASVVIINDELGKQPLALADLIAHYGISIWYSTPSILRLLVEFGKLDRHEYPKLRHVLFAGEVFPVKHLRNLKAIWSDPQFWNLYGPTETNVCTFLEIPPDIPEDRTEPYPIGGACSHCVTAVMDSDGNRLAPGDEGELYVSGASVMHGYWNLPEQNQKVFFRDRDGTQWYRTGDVVIEEDGIYLFRGRRDRMVKRRSYRVELGEIETALHRHPLIAEAAVVASPDEESGVLITAFVRCVDERRPSIIDLKKFSSENLPKYMIPDRFSIEAALPKTSTDKVDYQRLKDLVLN